MKTNIIFTLCLFLAYFFHQQGLGFSLVLIFLLPLSILFVSNIKNKKLRSIREGIFFLIIFLMALLETPDRENLYLIENGFDETKCYLFITNAIVMLILFFFKINRLEIPCESKPTD